MQNFHSENPIAFRFIFVAEIYGLGKRANALFTVFWISQSFSVQLQPMNSLWKGNLIIFVMALVLTRSNGQIKIKVSGALGVNPESNLVKDDENHRVARVLCRNMKNVVLRWFWPTLTFGQPRVDQGHFGQFDWKRHFECSDARTDCATSI